MKKKILFVCDNFFPTQTSIGICVGKIANEFNSNNYDVHILCYGEKKDNKISKLDNIKVHYIKRKLGERLIYLSRYKKSAVAKNLYLFVGKSIQRMNQLIFFHWSRMSSLIEPIRYCREIDKINKNEGIDIICSSHAPFDGLLGSYLFMKKENNSKKIFWVIYLLDSLTNKGKTKWISAKTNEKKGWKWEKKFFNKADLICDLKCDEEHNKIGKYDLYRDKICYVDIPLITGTSNSLEGSIELSKNETVLVYAGRLLTHLSSPTYLCDVLEEVYKKKDVKMIFFSSGDCERSIRLRDNNLFQYNDFIPNDELKREYDKADILVSIGSKESTDGMPSKIFEYINTRKKIIHIAKNRKDICIDYYKKYKNCLIIYEDDSVEYSSNKMIDFINSTMEEITNEEILTLFIENTPKYTFDVISSHWEKSKKCEK